MGEGMCEVSDTGQHYLNTDDPGFGRFVYGYQLSYTLRTPCPHLPRFSHSLCDVLRGCKQWVNYFLHAGHLEVEGLKMSKSLKNFTSIK